MNCRFGRVYSPNSLANPVNNSQIVFYFITPDNHFGNEFIADIYGHLKNL